MTQMTGLPCLLGALGLAVPAGSAGKDVDAPEVVIDHFPSRAGAM